MPIQVRQPLYTMTLTESVNRSPYPSKIQFHSSKLFDLFKQYMDETFMISKHRDSEKSLAAKYALFDTNTKTVDFSNYGEEAYIIGKFFLETHLNWPQLLNPMKIDEKSKGDPNLFLNTNVQWHIPHNVMKRMNQYEEPNNLLKSVFTKLSKFFTQASLERDLVIGTLIGLLVVLALAGTILGFVGTAGIGPFVFGTVAATLGPVGTGLSLGAIGINIVGFFTACFVIGGEYLRSNTKVAIHPKPLKNPYAPLLKTEKNFSDEIIYSHSNSYSDIDSSYSKQILISPPVKVNSPACKVEKKPGFIANPPTKPEEKISELERISKNTLSLLIGCEIFGAEEAKVYICKIAYLGKNNADSKEILIEEHLKSIEALIKRMPAKYHAKSKFHNYIEAIRAEIKPAASMAFQ